MQPAHLDSPEFPSVIGDDTQAGSAFDATMLHLRQALEELGELSPGSDLKKQKAHDELTKNLKRDIQLLHVHFAPSDTGKAKDFGSILRQHREEAGLTQNQLATFSGLSPSMIRKLEQGTKKPARGSLEALCGVAELKLVPEAVTTMPAVRANGHRSAPNWYVSPGFDAMQMMTELDHQLNGSGGTIEQTNVYLDHQSALDWFQISNMPGYIASFRDCLPHRALAERISKVMGSIGLDVIALGPGDGKTEVKLVRCLVEECSEPNIRFYLLDASQPLLGRAFMHAVDTFDSEVGVTVTGIQGNFYHLPRYMQIHYRPAQSHRRRVYLMLGDTIGNIDNEPHFFRNAFSGAAPGDLLIFDCTFVYTDSKDPAEIQKRDPTFQNPMPAVYQKWLGGPIRRHCQDLQSLSFSFRLDEDRPLEGSYGIQFVATAGFPGKRTKEFQMYEVRRYNPQSLIQCVSKLGWAHLATLPFSETRPKGVFIFQKRAMR